MHRDGLVRRNSTENTGKVDDPKTILFGVSPMRTLVGGVIGTAPVSLVPAMIAPEGCEDNSRKRERRDNSIVSTVVRDREPHPEASK